MKKRMIAFLLMLSFLFSFAAAEEETEPERLTNTDGYIYIVKEDGTAEIVGYTGTEKKLNIPSELDGYTVTSFGYKAFGQLKKITKITVPDTVKEIGSACFENCAALKEAVLPEGLEKIGNNAFWACKKLTKVNIPLSAEVDGCIFPICTSLKKVTLSKDHPILMLQDGVMFSRDGTTLLWYPAVKSAKTYRVPDGTQTIVSDAFCQAKVQKVVLPDSLVTIEGSAFVECGKLKEINIPPLITDLEGFTSNCSKLSTIKVEEGNPVFYTQDNVLFDRTKDQLVLYPVGKKGKTYEVPEGTKSIGSSAFSWSNLKKVIIPGSVTEIEGNAFLLCQSLQTVVLSEGLEKLGSYAFQWCTSIKTITLPSTLRETDGNPFMECHKLSQVIVAGDHAFYEVLDGALVNKQDMSLVWYASTDKRKHFEIPSGVKTINTKAFNNSKIQELVIPEGVETIKEWAFSGSTGLTRVTLPASLKSIEVQVFPDSLKKKAVFVVVSGSYAENYCLANGYKVEHSN